MPELDEGDLWYEDDVPDEVWCVACGEPARVVDVDFGIGAYEYWGATGFHTDIHRVTECCEADWQDFPPPGDEDVPDLDHIPASQVIG